MQGDVRYCKWCGKKFSAKGGRAYCCSDCSNEARDYWAYRGGKEEAGDAKLQKPENREMLFYRIAERIVVLKSGLPIEKADGIPAWDDFRQFAVDMAAEEDLTKRPNGRRLAQLWEKMAPILRMIAATGEKSGREADRKVDMSVDLRLFLQAYARYPAEYWRANPSQLIFY